MSLLPRYLTATITLAGSNTFKESGQNTATFSGLRMKAKIVKAGGQVMNSAQLEIYGMTFSEMNSVTTLGMRVIVVPKNLLTIKAGTDPNNLSTVFVGTIMNAWADFQAAPETLMHISAQSGGAESVTPADPTSFKGSASAVALLKPLAAAAGLNFENNSVTTQSSDPYYYGAVRNQIAQICNDYGINWTIDNGTLAVWPNNGSRQGDIPLIDPDPGGMVSYPTYVVQGITVKTIFNPSVTFFGQFQVQSDLPAACGTWIAYSLVHDLSCQYPGGEWSSTIGGYSVNGPPVVTQ